MKKRQIFIELTSLLDVILIMLFMVMVQAENKTEEAVEKAEQKEAAYMEMSEEYADLNQSFSDQKEEMDRIREELEEANRHLQSRDLVAENTDILTVSVLSDRRIVLESENNPAQSISYRWEEPNYAENRFRALLKEWIDNSGDKSRFLVFRFDADKIYYNEYEMMKRVIQDLRTELKKQNISFYYIETDIGSGK